MAQTVSNLTDVLKDAWTADRLRKQFYNDNPVFSRMSELEATTIGLQAQVPIHKSRNGGYVSTAAAGGTLQTAGQQAVDQAVYTLVFHWLSTQIEAAAILQAKGGDSSVVDAKDLEISGAVDDVKRQCSRQLATAADGKLAQCGTTSASATVTLSADSASNYGTQAIVRGWIYPGLIVDIGTTADTDAVVTAATVVDVDASAGTVTIDSAVTTTSSHFIYIANPNSATAANTEMNGFRNLVKTSGAVGGLNPSNSGESFWKAATEDSSSTALSLNLLLNLSRSVRQYTGKRETYNVTGLKQEQAFYELLQNQVRFSSNDVEAGFEGRAVWNGMEVQGLNDILDTDWFSTTIEDFVRIAPKGANGAAPIWATDLFGDGGAFQWSAGSTAGKNALVLPMQVGISRRNSHGALTGLTA